MIHGIATSTMVASTMIIATPRLMKTSPAHWRPGELCPVTSPAALTPDPRYAPVPPGKLFTADSAEFNGAHAAGCGPGRERWAARPRAAGRPVRRAARLFGAGAWAGLGRFARVAGQAVDEDVQEELEGARRNRPPRTRRRVRRGSEIATRAARRGSRAPCQPLPAGVRGVGASGRQGVEASDCGCGQRSTACGR